MSAKQIRRPTQPSVQVKRSVWPEHTVQPDPNGNREQRRAARKLGLAVAPDHSAAGGEPKATTQEASDLGGAS